MGSITRAAGAALTASVLALLIRRRDPEIALLLGALAAAGILFAAAAPMGDLLQMKELTLQYTGLDERLLMPVLKCLGISIVTRFAGELCKDASQGAAAMAVELMGSACALVTVLPLLIGLIRTIGGMM